MYESATLLFCISVPRLAQLLCLSPFHDLHDPNVLGSLWHGMLATVNFHSHTLLLSSAQGPNCTFTVS